MTEDESEPYLSPVEEKTRKRSKSDIQRKPKKIKKEIKKEIRVKKEKKVKIEKGDKVDKAEMGDKEDGEEEEQYKWWLETEKDDGVKWETLEHAGPLFPPKYEPHGIKMKYKGEVKLTRNPCRFEFRLRRNHVILRCITRN